MRLPDSVSKYTDEKALFCEMWGNVELDIRSETIEQDCESPEARLSRLAKKSFEYNLTKIWFMSVFIGVLVVFCCLRRIKKRNQAQDS